MATAKILIVEDEVLVAMDLEGILGDHGFRDVTLTHTAEDAVTLIAAGRFDAAFLDWNVGQGDTRAVARRLLAEGTPIIFISGYSLTPGLLAEFDAQHVPKPFGAPAIMAAVAAALS